MEILMNITSKSSDNKTLKQAVRLNKECTDYIQSAESVPTRVSANISKGTWAKMSKKERMLWHLRDIADSLGGNVFEGGFNFTYELLND